MPIAKINENLAISSKEKDIQLFEEVLNKLPENDIQRFCDELTREATYRKQFSDMLILFTEFCHRITSNFFDRQIQDYFSNLKQSIFDLDNFLISHFFLLNQQTFMLYPEMRNNNELVDPEDLPRSVRTKDDLRKFRKNELNNLVKMFLEKYTTFIQSSRLILYKPEVKGELLSATNQKPLEYKEMNGSGYFVHGKNKIRIAKVSARQAKLAKVLTGIFGAARSLDSVFDEIWLPKDDKNSSLRQEYTAVNERRKIIETTVKELYRVIARQNKIKPIDIKIENEKIWMQWRKK